MAQDESYEANTTDTHDGIGVVDVKDILTDEEIDFASNELYKVGANVKRKYSSAEYNNLDIYQINSTYYSALGDDDQKYLPALSRPLHQGSHRSTMLAS